MNFDSTISAIAAACYGIIGDNYYGGGATALTSAFRTGNGARLIELEYRRDVWTAETSEVWATFSTLVSEGEEEGIYSKVIDFDDDFMMKRPDDIDVIYGFASPETF